MEKEHLLSHLRRQGFSDAIVDAFDNVRREDFISDSFLPYAYDDRPLPLSEGSTISQPSTIAFMLELLDLEEEVSLLEIGSGCGYALALVNEITNGSRIFGVEINPEVCEFSRVILRGYDNISVFCRDGKNGLEEFAPFDRILISAACAESPCHLVDQLSKHGIIVASVRNSIVKIIKEGDRTKEEKYYGFSFVPLI